MVKQSERKVIRVVSSQTTEQAPTSQRVPSKKTGRPKKADRPVLSLLQEKALGLELADHSANDAFPKPADLVKSLGVTRGAVSKWRKDPVYLAARSAGVEKARLLRLENWAAELDQRLQERQDRPNRLRKAAIDRVTKNRATYLTSYAHRNWSGPISEPGGDKIFYTPKDWVDHMLQTGDLPKDIVDAELARLTDDG